MKKPHKPLKNQTEHDRQEQRVHEVKVGIVDNVHRWATGPPLPQELPRQASFTSEHFPEHRMMCTPDDKNQPEPRRKPRRSLLMQPCCPRPDSLIHGLNVRVKLRRWSHLVVVIVFVKILVDASSAHRIQHHVGLLLLGRVLIGLAKGITDKVAVANVAAITVANQLGTSEGVSTTPSNPL